MSYCTQCGFKLESEKAFCPQCGSKIGTVDVPAAEPGNNANTSTVPTDSSNGIQETIEVQAPTAFAFDGTTQPASADATPVQEPAAFQYSQQFPEQPGIGATPAQIAPPVPTDFTNTFDAEEVGKNKIFATASYLLGFVGIIIALLAAKDSDYVRFHVRESMKIQVLYALLGLVSVLLCWTIIIPILGCIAIVVLGVIEIICMVRTMMGQSKKVPLIGNWKMF